MKRNKYRILVLSDLKDSTKSTLKSAASLAKMLNASVDLFYAKKATDIVDQDNQLAVMRNIKREHVSTTKKLKGLVDNVSLNYGINIHSSFAFGNVKGEIKRHIERSNPDIVVIGKRKSNPLKLTGDNVTDFVLKSFKGSILIAPNTKTIEPNKELSLGLLNDAEGVLNMSLGQELLGHSKEPLKAFKIVQGSTNSKNETRFGEHKAVEFVFEQNDSSLKNLSNYLKKSDVNLAYLSRIKRGNKAKDNSISNIIGKIEVPILLSSEQEVA